jgi:transcriptional regulator with XRE-family HTH domain
MKWSEYVESRSAGLDQQLLAERMGVDQSTISRWKKRDDPPSVEVLIHLARVTGEPPTRALIRFGYLRESDVKGVVHLEASLADLDTADLLRELGRRLGVDLKREGRRGA